MGCVQKNSKQLPQTQCSTQTILINSVPIEFVGKVENDKLIKNKLRAASNSHLYEKALENENATNIEQRRQQWRSKITSISNNNSISVANSGSKNPCMTIKIFRSAQLLTPPKCFIQPNTPIKRNQKTSIDFQGNIL
ncbi:hypothetical protein pb186bvf_016101 [Paramecium bursaria]